MSKRKPIPITWPLHWELCKTCWASLIFDSKCVFQNNHLSWSHKILRVTITLLDNPVHRGQAMELYRWEFTGFTEQTVIAVLVKRMKMLLDWEHRLFPKISGFKCWRWSLFQLKSHGKWALIITSPPVFQMVLSCLWQPRPSIRHKNGGASPPHCEQPRETEVSAFVCCICCLVPLAGLAGLWFHNRLVKSIQHLPLLSWANLVI